LASSEKPNIQQSVGPASLLIVEWLISDHEHNRTFQAGDNP